MTLPPRLCVLLYIFERKKKCIKYNDVHAPCDAKDNTDIELPLQMFNSISLLLMFACMFLALGFCVVQFILFG